MEYFDETVKVCRKSSFSVEAITQNTKQGAGGIISMSIENIMKRYEDQKPDILSRKEESLVARVTGPDGRSSDHSGIS